MTDSFCKWKDKYCLNKKESDEPYYIPNNDYIKAGKYTLIATIGTEHFEQQIIVAEKPATLTHYPK